VSTYKIQTLTMSVLRHCDSHTCLLTQELVGHCLQLLQENHTRISSLEEYLQQYGYKPPDNLRESVNPLKLVMPSGKITSFLLRALSVSTLPSGVHCSCQHWSLLPQVKKTLQQTCSQTIHQPQFQVSRSRYVCNLITHTSGKVSSECIRTVQSIAHL